MCRFLKRTGFHRPKLLTPKVILRATTVNLHSILSKLIWGKVFRDQEPWSAPSLLATMECCDTTILGTLGALMTLVTYRSDGCKPFFRGNPEPGSLDQKFSLLEHEYIECFFYGGGWSDENDAIIGLDARSASSSSMKVT